jgi:GntR family transcriptional regulator
MDIRIVATSPEPVYEQIVRQIQDGVATGELEAGEPLPTVRQLADDLQLNRNTVARAYKQLEDRGVILTAGRRGTFVRADAPRKVERIKSSLAERKVEQVVSALLGEGVSREEIAALFNDALRSARRAKETASSASGSK